MNWCHVPYKFYKKYGQNLKYSVKKGLHFSYNSG